MKIIQRRLAAVILRLSKMSLITPDLISARKATGAEHHIHMPCMRVMLAREGRLIPKKISQKTYL